MLPLGVAASAPAASGPELTKVIMPLLSIIVGNCNYEKFVQIAIDSALAQTYPNVEIIVIDDGSTDGSRSLLQVTKIGFVWCSSRTAAPKARLMQAARSAWRDRHVPGCR